MGNTKASTRRVRSRHLGAAVLLGTAVVWGSSALPAVAARLDEKNLNLDVARRTAAALRARGIVVAQTRDRDVFVPLGERTALATRTNADAFISIHHNAGPSARSGTEIYRQVRGDARLSAHVSAAWRERMPGRSIQVIARPNASGGDYYFVLRNSPVPALLMEGGYMTNTADARRLNDPAFRQAQADATATGVVRWLGVAPAAAPPDLPPGARTTIDALPKPEALTAVLHGRRQVKLGWSTASLVEAYRVYRDGRLIGIVDNPTRTSTAAASIGFADTWVNSGATYRYEVRAVALKGDHAHESSAALVTATIPAPRVVVDPGHGGHDPGTHSNT